jgi:hypothetical protein
MDNNVQIAIPFSISAKRWFPATETLTGTFTSVGRMVKAGTTPIKAYNELQIGDWLLNPTTDEIRRITDISYVNNGAVPPVITNQIIYVESAFTTLTNATMVRVRNAQIKSLEYIFSAAGNARSAYSANAAVPAGTLFTAAQNEDGIIPMLLTPSSGTCDGIYKQ